MNLSLSVKFSHYVEFFYSVMLFKRSLSSSGQSEVIYNPRGNDRIRDPKSPVIEPLSGLEVLVFLYEVYPWRLVFSSIAGRVPLRLGASHSKSLLFLLALFT